MTDLDIASADCPFCGEGVEGRIIKECRTAIAIRDKYPVTVYHTLVLPRRHTPDFFSMTPQERRDAEALILRLKEDILETDRSVVGFNVGINCGEPAGPDDHACPCAPDSPQAWRHTESEGRGLDSG